MSSAQLETLCACVLLGASCVQAQVLPAGVPRSISHDGSVNVATTFTTEAYEREACRLILREASLVAQDLSLGETIPLVESSVVNKFINPFGYAFATKRIGWIETSRFRYGVEAGNKFSELIARDYDKI